MTGLIKRGVSTRVLVFVVIITFIVTLIASQIPALAANTFPRVYELVSVNNVNGQGVNRSATVSGVSYDGNKTLFTSDATNLPDANNDPQSRAGFMRDMNTGVTIRVDTSTSGTPANASFYHVMSATGRYVAFTSRATSLIDGATLSNDNRIYLKDLQSNSVSIIATIPSGGSASPRSISDDGRFIAISTSTVNDMIPDTRTGTDLGSNIDLVLYDTLNNTFTTPKGVSNTPSNSRISSISSNCDGSFIVFSSSATNLTDSHSGSGHHAFLLDVRNGMTITDLTPGATGDTLSVAPNISCNGRYIAYSTKDRTVVTPPSGLKAAIQVVRYDRFTGEKMYITDQAYTGDSSNLPPVSISDAGDVVLSASTTTSLYDRKVSLKHLSDGSGTLESVHHIYQGLNYEPQFTPTYLVSSNGKYVVVSSKAAEFLGLLPSSGNGSSIPSDIIRIKTGL